MARLGWVALGVLVGVVSGRVAARRSDAPQGPPVLASATRVELAAPPAAGSGSATPHAPGADPAPTASAQARPTPGPTPSPRPRPRPEQPTGRHAWVPPEEPAAADPAGDPAGGPSTGSGSGSGSDDAGPPRDGAPGAG